LPFFDEENQEKEKHSKRFKSPHLESLILPQLLEEEGKKKMKKMMKEIVKRDKERERKKKKN